MELRGKVVDFLGDSITEGVGVEDQENRFDRRLLRDLELKRAVNHGISGTRFAYQRIPYDEPSFDLYFPGRVRFIDPESSVIVVYGATNDFGHGDAPFGNDADRKPDTFCGACHLLFRSLTETYPGAEVVVMTPARRYDDDIPSKANSRPLVDYVDEIIRAAGQYGVHVLDLYRELPIDPHKKEDFDGFTSDGLHLNDRGHGVLAGLLKEFLQKL